MNLMVAVAGILQSINNYSKYTKCLTDVEVGIQKLGNLDRGTIRYATIDKIFLQAILGK